MFSYATSHTNYVCSHQAKSRKFRNSGPASETHDSDERLPKKRRVTLGDEDDMRWVRREIADMKGSLEKMAAEAREERDSIKATLHELLRVIQH
jgi:hypothetical protein